MWTRWVSLGVMLVLGPTAVRAEDSAAPARGRGFLTGLGISLLVVGVGGAGLGVAGVATSVDGQRLLNGFSKPLQTEDVTSYRATEKRVADAGALMAVGFITAGVALIGAILCLVLDAPKAPVQVTVAPTLKGGVVSVSLSF